MRISKVMEAIWLALSFICLVLGVYATINVGFEKSYMFFILTLASFLMFLVRRYRRRHFESNQPG